MDATPRRGWLGLLAVLTACGSQVAIESGAGGSNGDGGSGGSGLATGTGGDEVLACSSCPKTGWGCGGPNAECCDGEPCLQEPGGQGWFCGGVRAGGQDASCSGATDGCYWLEPNVCPDLGPISDICGPDASATQLRRCDGTCFVPDDLYQTFFVRSCDAADSDETCPSGTCGPIWDAVLCCE